MNALQAKPFTLRIANESVVVENNAKVVICYFYFENEEGRRHAMKRLSRAEALEAAAMFIETVGQGLATVTPGHS